MNAPALVSRFAAGLLLSFNPEQPRVPAGSPEGGEFAGGGGKGGTESPAFKAWFGDSKVVDGEGKPLVVYHGTHGDFQKFDIGRLGETSGNYGHMGAGFYFAVDPVEAQGYAGADFTGTTEGGNIKPAYLSLQRPLEINHDSLNATKELVRIAKKHGLTIYRHRISIKNLVDDNGAKEVADAVKAEGYDGIMGVWKGRPSGEIVAFHPNQIKSATGNRGTFDPKSDDITMSREPALVSRFARSLAPGPAALSRFARETLLHRCNGPVHFRVIDDEIHPICGAEPDPAGAARWKANRDAKIRAREKQEKSNGKRSGNGDGGGRRGNGSEPSQARGGVAPKGVRPAPAKADRGGQGARQPAGGRPAETVPEKVAEPAAKATPAKLEDVNRKIDRHAAFFRAKGQHEVAGWLDKLKGHVNSVGVEHALDSLGEGEGGPAKAGAQYQGVRDIGDFAKNYLSRTGIHIVGDEAEGVDAAKPVISSQSPSEGGFTRKGKGDFFPKDPRAATDKLEEAKRLPGLEKSEALPEGTTHLTPEVTAKLDAKYGKGKWIVKAYGDAAAAGYGIYFPQRAAQIQGDARATIRDAGEKLKQFGFSLDRDKGGKVVGLKHESGDRYKFGADEEGTPRNKKYTSTLYGEAREWADKAAKAAPHENGAALPGGGKEFMAQPAFNVVGVSEAERAAGKTIAPGEGRVHIVTRNGKAEVVPHSTWIKGEHLPVVFENDDTRAMAEAARNAVQNLPAKDRQGSIYAPDVVKTDQGYKVVEANPTNHTGGSGYLGDNAMVVDSFVSHLAGRDPAHVRFIRNLLTTRKGGANLSRAPQLQSAFGLQLMCT